MNYKPAPLNATPPDPILRKPVRVRLVGEDGNAFFILGRVTKAMRRAGYTAEEMDRYQREATSGDYDHLLQVTMAWVDDVGEERDEENSDG